MRAGISWGSIAILAAGAACLPRGEPPAGRQIIAGRDATLAAVAPPTGDGLLRLLVLRSVAGGTDEANLSVVELDPTNHVSAERQLISAVSASVGLVCNGKVAPCAFDARGWIMVTRTDGSQVWVDPVTGDVATAQVVRRFSDTGQRLFTSDGPGTGTLSEADGRSTTIDPVVPTSFTSARFVGEDFYYVDTQARLMDIPASGVAKPIAAGVASFTGWQTPDGALLVLDRATPAPGGTLSSLRDPVTGQETTLPFDGELATLSPDANWLLSLAHQFQGRYTFYNVRSGAQQEVDLQASAGFPQWRPGRSEVWVTTGEQYGLTTWSLRPDVAPFALPDIGLQPSRFAEDLGGLNPFSPDGELWFSVDPSPEVTGVPVKVGAADDPTGPRFPLNAPGTNVEQVWRVGDGRLVFEDYSDDLERQDVLAVDPRTGDTTLLGERGLVAALGNTRLIGMFRVAEGRGDLSAVALDSREKTMLAPEFALTAFAEPQGADLVAPGTRIVYQFQARTASPYDGIWVTSCP